LLNFIDHRAKSRGNHTLAMDRAVSPAPQGGSVGRSTFRCARTAADLAGAAARPSGRAAACSRSSTDPKTAAPPPFPDPAENSSSTISQPRDTIATDVTGTSPPMRTRTTLVGRLLTMKARNQAVLGPGQPHRGEVSASLAQCFWKNCRDFLSNVRKSVSNHHARLSCAADASFISVA